MADSKDSIKFQPAADLPEHQVDLLRAHDEFLRKAMAWMAPAAPQLRASAGSFILATIFIRLLQHGRAIQNLALCGFADEAQGLARGMVSAASDLLFVDQADADSRALLYGLFSQKRRRRWARSLVTHGLQSEAQFQKWDHGETKKEDEALAQHAKAGVKPASRVGEANTWTGLKDEQQIKLVGRADWYDLYYVPFSDAAHANILGAAPQLKQLARGEFEIGPRVNPEMLQLVIMASVDTIAKSVLQLDRRFGLGKEAAIDAAVKEVGVALQRYLASRPKSDDDATADPFPETISGG